MNTTPRPAASAPADASLAVVIPTHNRAALAADAVRSLLDQPGCRLQVFVSDNSSDEEEARHLENFCRGLGSPSVIYMRPPESLPMPEHWDWAVQRALALSDASHFTVHYDRKVSKPRHLSLIARVAARHPAQLITYTLDMVVDDPPPIYVYQTPWTGKLYQVRTERVLQLTARGRVSDMGQSFPILSNCLVPRAVLERIRERFGDVCNSTGPDSCFTYRFCALNERYLHFDRPLGIIYASHRSNGLGYLRGKTDGDFGDFLRTWGDRPWLEAAPIPGLNLGQNMLYHEYVLVQRAVGGDRFPPIDMEGYARELSAGLRLIDDPRLRDSMRAVLKKHGWREETEAAAAPPAVADGEATKARRPRRARLRPRRLLASAAARSQNILMRLTRRQEVVFFLADYLRIKPPHIHGFTFNDNDEAIRYALSCPRKPEAENPYIQSLEPSEIDCAAWPKSASPTSPTS